MRNSSALARHRFSGGLPKQLALCLVLAAVCSRHSEAQDAPAPSKWPGPGQLFVGTCYQLVDRSAEQIDRAGAQLHLQNGGPRTRSQNSRGSLREGCGWADLYVNTTQSEQRIPIEGRHKGMIGGRVCEGAVVLGPQDADLIP